MAHYDINAINHLRVFLPGHATVDATLGVAYELRTANLLALMHMDHVAPEILTIACAQILERLDLGHHDADK